MSSLHGTKTIALGTRSAMLMVSCAAPECMVTNGSPLAPAAVSRAPTTRPSNGMGDRVWRSLYSALPDGLLCESRHVAGDAAKGLLVHAPDVEEEAGLAGDGVDEVGL
jgi:hypothetical protein